MKILIIGDIHGRDNWKQIIEDNPEVDKVIFLGDYTDSYDKTNVEILHNLKEIIAYKDANPQTELLIGNHDYGYIYGGIHEFYCSGQRGEAYYDLHELFLTHLHYFKFIHQEGIYLFSHAGITKKWFNKYKDILKAALVEITDGEVSAKTLKQIPNLINDTIESKMIQHIMYEVGPQRGGMRYDNGSPIWADQNETVIDALPNYVHVVGHTPQRKTGVRYFKVDDTTGIWYCDAIEHNLKNHLILEINK